MHIPVLLLFAGLAVAPVHGQSGVPAYPADSFVESIGVNTHWTYDNVYTHGYDILKMKLGEAGIRYVRDGANLPTYNRANDLYYNLGIRTNMLTGKRAGWYPAPLDPSQIDAELNEIKTHALAATVSLESPNEYDIMHGPDTNWVDNIKRYHQDLYTKAKADPALRDLPIIGPSFTSSSAYEIVGNLDESIDQANIHAYQSDRWPGTGGWGDNGYGSLTWVFNDIVKWQTPSGKPVQSIESGYHNEIAHDGLSEEADGKYTARMYAEFFRRGITRTFKYELVDQGRYYKEESFGLLRNDLSEKPSYRAVKNLIRLLSDKGPTFATDSLNYVLNGNTNNVRQILFQKRNGEFYLMLWLEVPSWEVHTNVDLYPPPQDVTLTFPTGHEIKGATFHTLNNNADLITSTPTIVDESTLVLSVTDKISILQLPRDGPVSGAVYRLMPKSAIGSCLEVSGVSRDNEAPVDQWPYWGGANQHWRLEGVGGGYYRLVNQNSGRVLTVNRCDRDSGANVQQYDWLGSDCQMWKFDLVSDGSGYYRITPRHAPGKSLDVDGCLPDAGTKVQLWTWLNSSCQNWKLYRV